MKGVGRTAILTRNKGQSYYLNLNLHGNLKNTTFALLDKNPYLCCAGE